MNESEIMNEALEFLYDLRGEWAWKKDEPRAGNKKEYDNLGKLIDRMEHLLQRGKYGPPAA